MTTIHLLNQDTIDKIAAGEVVERPLSVVKELTENAIDAGATAISVEIKDGGISLIRVTDNGCGIEKSQVKKAFLRHATSKISEAEDLNHIHSLGFRGEALSSIAAVSQMELITKTPEEFTGTHYQMDGGKEKAFEEIGAPNGTTFLVRNLFYNVPARRKFLKQPQTEGSYVADMMEHLALSRPDISVKLIINGQVRFQTSGNGNLKEVAYRIYGREVVDGLVAFQYQDASLCIEGFLGKPELNRSNRNYENFFVNGRYVRNRLLEKAVEEGYRTYLMQHKFPFCILHFTFLPEDIDVNVHPSKMEIRIHKGVEIYDAIADSIKESLHQIELIPKVSLSEDSVDKPVFIKTPEPFEVNRIQEEETPYRVSLSKIIGEPVTPKAERSIHDNIIKATEHIIVEKPVQMDLFEENFVDAKSREQYRVLGQIFDTYWLIAFQDKLFIMDQHAAHEKVKYEKLLKAFHEKTIMSQQITPPVVLNLNSKELQVLTEMKSYFEELGFELEDFGMGSYTLRSMPLDLYGCNELEFFQEILDELCENPMKDQPDVILNKLASMACKSAVKGNHSMTIDEVCALLDELLTLDNPYHCPHGRPTIISMSKYEIEKKFKRIVS